MLTRSLPTSLLTLLSTLLFNHSPASAHSTIRNPIHSLTTIQNATLSPAHIHALSSFTLSFTVPPSQHIQLHLEPNHDILASDAHVTYFAPDGTIRHAEPIDRLDHKVFKGSTWVARDRDLDDWEMVGWSRIVVSREGKEPVFEGAFAIDHDHHHVQSARNYMLTRHELDPVVEVGGEEESSAVMVVWKDSDIMRTVPGKGAGHKELKRKVIEVQEDVATCEANTLSFNSAPDHPVFQATAKRDEHSYGQMDFASLFAKRQIDGTGNTGGNGAGVNLSSTIGQPAGCPTTRKVALVGVATDCTYTASFNSTATAKQNVLTQMNTASGVWESAFNISLGVQNITISDASCPGTPAAATMWNQACSDNVQISDRLNYFSEWRGLQKDTNSHWTLLSTCNTGSAVGLAWLGQACVTSSFTTNTSSSGGGGVTAGTEIVSGANVVIKTSGANEWQIIAHETGHTFGAVHDCDSSACANANFVASQQCCPLSGSTCDANAQYIMNPSAVMGVTKFSPCTVGNICSALGRNSVNSTCLTANKQVTTVSGQVCGNGIVEAGEDCDCGGTAGCGDNKCCNPTTCKFTTGSVCDDANEDCCASCQLKSNGTICRESTGSCNPAEYCTGTSAVCPADVTASDGQSCGGGNGLACASGQCTSRDQQCKTAMGSYTSGNSTYACGDSTCYISCASPEFGPNVCYSLQQNFLDGTPCNGNGKCRNGLCAGSTVSGRVKSWMDEHKDIVIGIAVSVGGLALLAILCCLLSCCRSRRRRGRRAANAPPAAPAVPLPPPGGWQGWGSAPAGGNAGGRGAPQMEQLPSHGWFGGRAGRSAPVPAPPSQAFLARGQSVRYA